jgi:hypothetical protein
MYHSSSGMVGMDSLDLSIVVSCVGGATGVRCEQLEWRCEMGPPAGHLGATGCTTAPPPWVIQPMWRGIFSGLMACLQHMQQPFTLAAVSSLDWPFTVRSLHRWSVPSTSPGETKVSSPKRHLGSSWFWLWGPHQALHLLYHPHL